MTFERAGDDQDRALNLALSPDEALILNNALNEVCNGVDIEDWEFPTRLGGDREEARALLVRVGQLLDGA
jgi:hypothetical protein